MIRLRGPRDILGFRPTSAREMLAIAAAIAAAKREGRPAVVRAETLTREADQMDLAAVPVDGEIEARVEYGRWIGDCPCRAGVAVHPEWEMVACLECGRVLRVRAPHNIAEIEDALLARVDDHERHWRPGQAIPTRREPHGGRE